MLLTSQALYQLTLDHYSVKVRAIPLCCVGGDQDIERADEEMRKLFPENEKLLRWLDLAEEKFHIKDYHHVLLG